MCKTFVDGSGHDESKWHYTKANKLGFQGTFVLKTEKEFKKKARPKSEKHYYYPNRDGSNLVRVTRKDDGKGNRKFYQGHWDGGKWVNENPDEFKVLILIYRQAEVQKAIERNEQVFIVEGESTADALWALEIAATTTIGGCGGYANYGNYSEDLKGARLVLSPDRDANGIKYISNFERDFSNQIEGYYLAGTQDLWKKPEGGMDINDDIIDHEYTQEQLLDRIITPEKYQQIFVNKSDKESGDRELAQDLKNSIELKDGKAPCVFGGQLGYLLSIAASNFSIPTEILTFCLLPILGSQIDSRTELMINPGTDYRVPAIRWTGLVGETGSKKSPVLGILTKALSVQQNELYEVYKANKLAFDAEFRAWKAKLPKDRDEEPEQPAPLRDLYFSDFTIEGLISSLGNYPNNGYLLSLDELASFFSAMDAYRGGKGGDRQKWLTIWNGGGIKVNRKSTDTICVPQSSISIVGGIQPQTIANLIGGDDSQQDGLWNRFAFMGLPHNPTKAFSETPGDLREELDKIYRALSSHDHQTHCLSLEAKPLWEAWHDETEVKTISESNWLIKGTYAKFEGIAGRNALIIHRTLAAIEGCEPTQLVSADVLELAIAWTQFELNQTLSQYQLLAIDGTNPKQVRILKFIDKFKGKGWINARSVSRWWTTKPIPSADKIRSFMADVVSLGHAIGNTEPVDSATYQIQIPEKSTDNTDKLPVTVATKGLNRVEFSADIGTVSTDKSTDNLDSGVNSANGFKVIGDFVGSSSDNSKPLINSHPVDSPDNTVESSTDTLNSIQANDSNSFVSTVSTFSNNKNLESGKVNQFKIGDRVKNKRLDQIGSIKDIRTKKTPKGSEFTQYLVDFGTDKDWYESVVLILEVA
jgi:hypothetical protein